MFNSTMSDKTLSKAIQRVPIWMYTTFLSVLILFSVAFYLMSTVQTASTDVGEKKRIVLPDGSKVLLNSNASISFKKSDWFSGNKMLQLNGEAYFKVKNGATFTIVTNTSVIYDVGTAFSVNSQQNAIEITCFKGVVKLKNNAQEILVPETMSYKKTANNIYQINKAINLTPSWIE